MATYTVTVKAISATEPAAFFGLSNYDPDAFAELESSDGEVEIYTIETNVEIDRFLDMVPNVITYTAR